MRRTIVGVIKSLFSVILRLGIAFGFAYVMFLSGVYYASIDRFSRELLHLQATAEAWIHYSTSKDAPPRVQGIYKKLKWAAIDTYGLAPTVKVSTVLQGENAFVYLDGQIYVTPELVKNSTDDQLALVLGHEMAHYQLRHTHPLLSFDDRPQKYQEYHSDILGAWYAASSGYNVCKGADIYLRWIRVNGQHFGDSHPSAIERALYFKWYCRKIGDRQ